jgi:crotonobetainyl-CoA:carnitine CoA-transferase CaiB-like acyl-CoA transferase
MKLGDVANADAAPFGRPLDGVRILAVEQMQALPFATQLLARLGAEVVKVEHPGSGESGRGSYPAMIDPEGRKVGATFLRNNLNKRSVAIDLKHPEGRELLLRLAPKFDVVAENFKAGTMGRLGLGYEAVAERHPTVVYLSLSGFGNHVDGLGDSPYRSWPAYASIVEAMSGIYEYRKEPGRRPRANPVGAFGDISSALFGAIGLLAALRHRDRTGEGQQVDIAMLDALVCMTDIVTNLWSLGVHRSMEEEIKIIIDTFPASDGHFVLQVGRPHQFVKLAEVIGHPEWLDDERFADQAGWVDNFDTLVRPAIEKWASTRTRAEACTVLGGAGLAAGPCHTPPEVIADPHLAGRDMLVEMPRSDDVAEPVLIPGNPIKMSKVATGPESRVPWLGEHTDEVLAAELGLGGDDLASLRKAGAIG